MTDATSDPTIGWGILATGKIAHTFAGDLALVPGARLAAGGSRRLEAAQEFAAALDDHADIEAVIVASAPPG